MKQSEKYNMLQWLWWKHFVEGGIKMYDDSNDNNYYPIHEYKLSGKEVKEMWSKLLDFRDKAIKKEEKRGGQTMTAFCRDAAFSLKERKKDFDRALSNLKEMNKTIEKISPVKEKPKITYSENWNTFTYITENKSGRV